jgi:hypothetical protein
MKLIKFVVKVNRSGFRHPEFVQRIDRDPIQTTTNRKLALVMGRFTAEDTIQAIQNSRCTPELVPVGERLILSGKKMLFPVPTDRLHPLSKAI